MDALTLRNFRCFLDLGSLPLRPLTLLVGENSTGKSSFLAAVRLAWDTVYNRGKRVDFNEEPFLLGAFDQIAHFRGGRAGRASSFSIGFKQRTRRARSTHAATRPIAQISFETQFRQSGSHAFIESQSLKLDRVGLAVTFDDITNQPALRLEIKGNESTHSLRELGFPVRFSPDAPLDWSYILYLLTRMGLSDQKPNKNIAALNSQSATLNEIRKEIVVGSKNRPIAIAPVRTRPQRTYNPISETPLPEGDHVPMVLAKTFFSDKDRWQSLSESLDAFGSDSGLYSNIAIKGLGHSESDPFQLRVKIEGPSANLIDVGYGVSQVLPILVDSLVADRGNQFLMQQPEVHLHPRAQAALGTFLARLAGRHGKRFIVETHSDYLVDRVRMAVRDGKTIRPTDVLLIFFERDGIELVVHPISLDERGNLIEVPAGFRQFFLEEEGRLLGV